MYFFKSILSKKFKIQKKEQPEPSVNQVLTFPFDIADKYTTPVVFSIVSSDNGLVSYTTNFSSKIKTNSVSYFKENLICQN